MNLLHFRDCCIYANQLMDKLILRLKVDYANLSILSQYISEIAYNEHYVELDLKDSYVLISILVALRDTNKPYAFCFHRCFKNNLACDRFESDWFGDLSLATIVSELNFFLNGSSQMSLFDFLDADGNFV